tara:strand:- start:42237 stop:42860 length:624 start_codon:yes stop_codon:yes gene_type:complete
MPRFTGQNKRRIDPRYFLEETIEKTEDLEVLEEKKKRKTRVTKKKKSFPDLTGDGKVTRADILKGRGVITEKEPACGDPKCKCPECAKGNVGSSKCKCVKKEGAFSGNGPLAEPIEEKKKKRKKKGSSRCTKVTKKTSSTRKGKKWMKCVKSDSGGYKRIHWGQAGVRVTGKSGNTKRKKSFKARHGCSTAKSNTPKGQACKDWAEE